MVEYSDNYADTSGTLYQLKRDEQSMSNGNLADVTAGASSSFEYKSSFFKTLTGDDNGVFKNLKIVVPLKYLSNFFRSLEMPLVNCKIHLELNWTKNCVMSIIDGVTTFKIKNTKFYIQSLHYQIKIM